MLTLAFHTVPESLQKGSAIPLRSLHVPQNLVSWVPILCPGWFLLWEYDGGVYLERMLSLRNHGTPRGVVRRQWALLVWD